MKRLLLLICLAVLSGCAGHNTSTGSSARDPQKPTQTGSFFAGQTLQPSSPRDPQADPRLLVQLSVYKMTVPARSVSHNEEFWKHLDEQSSLDVAQHDILYANGFRVGVAPRRDWDYFKKILERESITSQITGSSGIGGSAIEMPFKAAVPQLSMMYIHPAKGLTGKIYDQCDELMSVHFEAVPREVGNVRITAVPFFRSVRTEIAYTPRNEPQPYSFVHPEYVFDLKLDVDVPFDHFLIVAPSTDADSAVTLGHKMLDSIKNGKEYETILVMSPQPFVFSAPATQTTQIVGN